METKITRLCGWTPWIEGTAGGYVFQAKVMDSPSSYGINGGRVIKFAAYEEPGQLDRRFILNYDRGWDVRPEGAEHKKVYQAIMDLLEHRE